MQQGQTIQSLGADPLLAGIPAHQGYKVLGGVVLYQKLGQGGMGAVYKGRHLRLNVDVAVKVMSPALSLAPAEAESFIQRFIREAQTTASIRHQNLIRVIDVNTECGIYYLVMDFVDGETAGEKLKRRRRLVEQEAVEIVLGAAEGLAQAHRKGIVHRDVKPDNLLIDDDGNIVVVDLGLAKAFDLNVPGALRRSGGISLPQQALGTPQYMSPEQTRSARNVGPASDVWSLGVTLYELVAGEPPFYSNDFVELVTAIRREEVPDIRRKRPEASPDLAEILETALKKSPALRYTDCGQMAEVLRRHLDGLRGRGNAVLREAGVRPKSRQEAVSPPAQKTISLIAQAALGSSSRVAKPDGSGRRRARRIKDPSREFTRMDTRLLESLCTRIKACSDEQVTRKSGEDIQDAPTLMLPWSAAGFNLFRMRALDILRSTALWAIIFSLILWVPLGLLVVRWVRALAAEEDPSAIEAVLPADRAEPRNGETRRGP